VRQICADVPCEALTSPALLSQRERREKDRKLEMKIFEKPFPVALFLFPSLPLGERG
jgi:hypothetical protein